MGDYEKMKVRREAYVKVAKIVETWTDDELK